MHRTIHTKNGTIPYELTWKPVKNINLRITDGTLRVSAPRQVPMHQLEQVIQSRADWIMQAMERQAASRQGQQRAEGYTDEQCLAYFEQLRQSLAPVLQDLAPLDVPLKVRTMKSCWGVCHLKSRTITLNRRLMEVPRQAAEYVLLHEYVHFRYPNHQAGFHAEMQKRMPDYLARRTLLRQEANTGEAKGKEYRHEHTATG